MAHCSAMICQQVTLSGDAEWPKVADAVIEAPYRDQCHGPLLASGRYQDEAQCDINLSPSPLLEHYQHSLGKGHLSLGVVGSSGKPRTRKDSGKRPTVGLSVRPKAIPAHYGHTTAARHGE